MTAIDHSAAQPQRDYMFAGFASLLVIYVGLTIRGDPLIGLIPPAVGAIALVFRTPSLPIVFLVVLSYLMVYPLGVPFTVGTEDIEGSRFRVQDMLIAAAVLLYLMCLYRSFGLALDAMPADSPRPGVRPTRRPYSAVPDDEFPRMLLAVVGFVLAGQLVWLLLSTCSLDLSRFPPLSLEPQRYRDPSPFALSPSGVRFLLLAGIVVVFGFIAQFALGYYRLVRLTRDEARMLLLDMGWRESRRELNRQEKWRAWAIRRRGERPDEGSAAGRLPALLWVCTVVAFAAVILSIIGKGIFAG